MTHRDQWPLRGNRWPQDGRLANASAVRAMREHETMFYFFAFALHIWAAAVRQTRVWLNYANRC